MMQKPKYGWWVVPGGKMEPTESISQTVSREFFEETNLKLENPTLRAVFTIVLKEQDAIVDEWMLFTFHATKFNGKLVPLSNEGILQWQEISEVADLAKAKGDNFYLEHILNPQSKGIISGTFIYTPNYELIAYSIDQKSPVEQTLQI